MRIHPVAMGHVVLKRAFLHPRPGLRRRLDLVLPGPWMDVMPIRGWLVEHDEERILIDMGETGRAVDTCPCYRAGLQGRRGCAASLVRNVLLGEDGRGGCSVMDGTVRPPGRRAAAARPKQSRWRV